MTFMPTLYIYIYSLSFVTLNYSIYIIPSLVTSISFRFLTSQFIWLAYNFFESYIYCFHFFLRSLIFCNSHIIYYILLFSISITCILFNVYIFKFPPSPTHSIFINNPTCLLLSIHISTNGSYHCLRWKVELKHNSKTFYTTLGNAKSINL